MKAPAPKGVQSGPPAEEAADHTISIAITADVALYPHPRAARRAVADFRERRLFERCRRENDPVAREELIRRYLPLARQLAHRYRRSNEPLDDLMQVACLALVKAVDRFDPDRGVAFQSFAVPTILGELKRHFRDTSWAVRLPRTLRERAMAVHQCLERLSPGLGRSPTPAEVADSLELTLAQVLEAMEATLAREAISLDTPRSTREGEDDTIGDTLGKEDNRFELVEYGATLAPCLRDLPPRDRLVLHLRFVEDLSQSQIAARIGLSQMQVSRVFRNALARLREDVERVPPEACQVSPDA